MERLLNLEQVEDSIKVENKFITDRQKVAKELEPLVKVINFKRIKGHILVDIIEPLEIVPTEMILNVYQHNSKLINSDLNDVRGIPIYRFNDSNLVVWDELACGSNLIIEDN